MKKYRIIADIEITPTTKLNKMLHEEGCYKDLKEFLEDYAQHAISNQLMEDIEKDYDVLIEVNEKLKISQKHTK